MTNLKWNIFLYYIWNIGFFQVVYGKKLREIGIYSHTRDPDFLMIGDGACFFGTAVVKLKNARPPLHVLLRCRRSLKNSAFWFTTILPAVTVDTVGTAEFRIIYHAVAACNSTSPSLPMHNT